jgi:hypothetical protein
MDENLFSLLSKNDFQDFLFANEHLDEKEFVLKHKNVFGIPSGIIANQFVGRRKAKIKLASFYNTRGIIYPPSINIEQSSSEATAKFKTEIIQEHVKNSDFKGVDLTGGFGIDSFFLSKNCSSFQYIEKEAPVLQLAKFNHIKLGATNIEYNQTTAEDFINSSKNNFDFIFVDPSRRAKKGRVYEFSECDPSIDILLPKLFEHTYLVLVKASPLLDLQQGARELQFVKNSYVVSVDNECKEVLFLCEKGYSGEPAINAVDLSDNRSTLQFTFSTEKNSNVLYSEPLTFLYEPNASILKAGAFKYVSTHFNLFKLHVNTHLYTSRQFVENFPGRVFKIELINAKENDLKKFFATGKANVATRNYPLSADELKKKFYLKDGGDLFLFGVTSEKRMLLIAKRID